MEETARNYARFLKSDDRWMLSRLIVPASRLEELDPFADELFPTGKVRVSAVGRGGNDLAELDAGLTEDLKAIRAFHMKHRDRAKVNAFDLTIPPAVSAAALGVVVNALAKKKLQVFVEMPVLQLGSVHEAVHEAGAGGIAFCCGGADARTIPSVNQLALVIAASAAANKPLKFTGRLRQPVRRPGAAGSANTHGFMNVLFAAIAAHVLRIRTEAILGILQTEDAEQFEVNNEGIRCGGHRLTVAQVIEGRKMVKSFGSDEVEQISGELRTLD